MIICFNSKSFLNLLSNIWQFSSLFDLVPGLEGLLFRVKASLPESAGASNSQLLISLSLFMRALYHLQEMIDLEDFSKEVISCDDL